MSDSQPSPGLGPRQMVWAGTILLAMAALLVVAARVMDVLLLAFLAVVFASVLNHPIGYLARYLPRALATIAVVSATIALLLGAAWAAWPTLRRQAEFLLGQAPALLDRVEEWWPASASVDSGSRRAFFASLRELLEQQVAGLLGKTFPIALGLLSALATLILVLAISAFLAHRPYDLLAGIVRLVPERRREAAGRLLLSLGVSIQRWMLGTLFNMTTTGALTALGLLALGVDGWLVLGFLMFLGEFVPFIGPVLAAIPGIAVGLASSPSKALHVLGVYLIVQQIEGNLLQPIVMRHAVHIHPALLLVWALVMATLFGVLGLMAATPLLAMIYAAVDTFYPRTRSQ